MKIRKLTRKEFESIFTRRFSNRFFKYSLIKKPNDDFILIKEWKTILKIVLFVPLLIVIFFHCLWDEGLKYIPKNIDDLWSSPLMERISKDYYYDSKYDILKKIYENA